MNDDPKREAQNAALAQSVKTLRENLPALIEIHQLNARLLRKRFIALVAEGFNEQQALELCKGHIA